eukprot:CAMPEP_0170489628 /NCGR_PEP_ID=MMETSP0208-20121228/7938_1 /TAXON_ID=197538 /ORGANISM="Strombidium inclinatum, Strain S3" /LENGTH=62 /DNA_ID=CAMNT_0010764617 /DNA_START=2029 /DNA_END=2217 /DNA_ORIENTATION=-
MQITKDAREENEQIKKDAHRIIHKINSELHSGNTKRYCNYIDMGMVNEEFAIDQNLKTASML